VRELVNVDLAFVFSVNKLLLTLAGTVALGLVVTALPIRRAVRTPAGEALRYA
jgi:ABC-type lipoprotein release transport system permease subunit